jgi:hypothetical protein
MTRRLFSAVAALAIVVGSAEPAAAQFAVGFTDVGAVIGVGGLGDASMSFGGRFERGWRPAPEGLGTGVIGIQVAADYYSWSGPGWNWSYIPVGATANYHFNLENDRIDPFLGLGLGFEIFSCDYVGTFDYCDTISSGIYPIGRAGIRYFLSPNLALYGDLGAGAALLNAGATFKVSD